MLDQAIAEAERPGGDQAIAEAETQDERAGVDQAIAEAETQDERAGGDLGQDEDFMRRKELTNYLRLNVVLILVEFAILSICGVPLSSL